MAFDIKYSNRVSSGANTDVPSMYVYAEDVILATITASAYFNNWKSLKIGDLLYIQGSDGQNFYKVTAVSPDVTVAAVTAVAT
jgi:hypothetical protein